MMSLPPPPGQTRLQQWLQFLYFSLLANDINAARKASHRGPDGETQDAFLEVFTKFAFQYGRAQLRHLGTLRHIHCEMIFAAFRESNPSYAEEHPSPPFFIPKKLDPYFSRSDWLAAVQADDASLFQAKRQLNPVQLASTIQEKMDLRPDIRPCIDWCVAWLQSKPITGRKATLLANAFEAARILAVEEVEGTDAKPRSPFQIKYESVRAGCNIPFQMLLKYAATDGTAVQASESGDDGLSLAEVEADTLFDSDVVVGGFEAIRIPGNNGI